MCDLLLFSFPIILYDCQLERFQQMDVEIPLVDSSVQTMRNCAEKGLIHCHKAKGTTIVREKITVSQRALKEETTSYQAEHCCHAADGF